MPIPAAKRLAVVLALASLWIVAFALLPARRAAAQEVSPPEPTASAVAATPPEGAASAAGEAAAPQAPAAPASAASAPAGTRLEGAIGAVFRVQPNYHGSSAYKLSLRPGFFLRYGRLTVSNVGAFASRRSDDLFRGLGAEFFQQSKVRLNLGLRIDRGRRSAQYPELAGMDNVPATLRGRATASWEFARGSTLGLNWSPDLANRGGGQLVDIAVGHTTPLAPDLSLDAGVNLGWADARYMRSYFGVTPVESVRSGYPVYTPGAGWRSLSVGISLKYEFDPRWISFFGASAGHALGPTVDSPLTRSVNSWMLSTGVAWKF